jgi:hypothetical protein
MVLGVGLVLLGLGEGFDKFSVYNGHGEKETCAAFFHGSGDDPDADAALQKRSLDELGHGPLWQYGEGPGYAQLCDQKRGQRGLMTWGLLGVGVLLIVGCGVIFWPTKSNKGGAPAETG